MVKKKTKGKGSSLGFVFTGGLADKVVQLTDLHDIKFRFTDSSQSWETRRT